MPRSEIVGPFLSHVLRMLADRGIGFVVAVHDSYTELDEYEDATASGTLETQIRVPPLEDRGSLDKVLTHRIWVHSGCA
ncbi:MAG: hypothetical protein M3340_15235, partial [Actinomycetota bacterium]|nr:hypothetical protein [Actinomycetota bacterium]